MIYKLEVTDSQEVVPFAKRERWISEIDVCMLSQSLVKNVISFDTRKDITLPSDHAEIYLNSKPSN